MARDDETKLFAVRGGGSGVVQSDAARRLHMHGRLEREGVVHSWRIMLISR